MKIADLSSIETIILLILLTGLIFALALLTFSTVYKKLEEEVNNEANEKDVVDKVAEEIRRKSKHKVLNSIERYISAALLILLTVLTINSNLNGSSTQFTIDNKTAFVVASDSMDGFYNTNYKEMLVSVKEDAAKQQFKVGDIGIFETVNSTDNLVLYDVYGYLSKDGKIILHRYVDNKDNKLMFRGDNTKKSDSLVSRAQVLYHFTGTKIAYVGNFVLFSKSLLFLLTLIAAIIIILLADVYVGKYNKLLNTRRNEIVGQYYKAKNPKKLTYDLDLGTGFLYAADFENVVEEETSQLTPKEAYYKEKLSKLDDFAIAEFDRKDGTHVIIYPKGSGKKCVCIKKSC